MGHYWMALDGTGWYWVVCICGIRKDGLECYDKIRWYCLVGWYWLNVMGWYILACDVIQMIGCIV